MLLRDGMYMKQWKGPGMACWKRAVVIMGTHKNTMLFLVVCGGLATEGGVQCLEV